MTVRFTELEKTIERQQEEIIQLRRTMPEAKPKRNGNYFRHRKKRYIIGPPFHSCRLVFVNQFLFFSDSIVEYRVPGYLTFSSFVRVLDFSSI